MGGGKGTSTSTTRPPKEIMDAYKQSLGLAEQAISQPYQQYQGQMVAGLNPTQLQGISNVNAAQGAALPYIQQGAGYVNQAAQGVNPGMINQFMSPYLNNVVGATQRNLMESNAQQQMAMKSGAIQSGAFGGDRARFGQAELARQQGLAGGQVIGGLLNQGYGQALAGAQQNVQNMMQGGNMLGALGQSAQGSILQGAQAQMAAGAQQQATEQAGLQAMYDQFLQRQSYPYQQAQFFANIAQGIGAGAGGTTSQTPAAPNVGSQVLGGLSTIASIYGMSDERMKENIKPVGKTNDGQTIYKYNFKGSPKTEIGLIAQEVEKNTPDAVASLGGIKMVDYDKATEGAERQGKAFGGSSMGGLVTPDMQRQAFAQGGFGAVPYADFMKGLSYVPSGELSYRGQSPGSTFPKGFSQEELERIAQGSDFDPINSMSEKQLAGLKSGFGKLGTSLGLSPTSDGADGVRAPTYSGPLSNFGPGVTNFFSGVGSALGFADGGGVVPRHGYATDGAVEEGLPAFLRKSESGDNFAADNEMGYVGRGQFGEARLTDAKRAGVIPPDLTQEQFLNDPDLQVAVENWHTQDVNNFIQDRGLGAFVGKEINGVPVTEQGLLAVAHLGGKGGMEKFLKSEGRYNPSDANGTSLMDYLALAADNSGGVVPSNMPEANVKVSPASDEAPARSRTIIESILGQDLSDQARTGMLAAGLAMLGGRSPYFGVNVGKGGLAGLQAYYSGLTNERELAKMGAELDLRGYEAKTGRMQAETAREQMVRQLYMQILPLVQFYQAEGRPIPPQYQRIIDEATSLGVAGETPAVAPAERLAPAEGTTPAPAPAGVGPGAATDAAPVTAAPAVEAPDIPNATQTSAPVAPPVETDTTVTNANPELARLYSQLPDDQNPYKLLEKANRAMTFEMAQSYRDQANALTQQYRDSGIPLPSGNVGFPGVAETAAERRRIEELGAGEAKIVNDFNTQMADTQSGFGSRTMIVDGLRDVLTTAESGRFAEFKADLVNAAAALGLANAAQLEEAADVQTAMKLFANSILDSGMKDKIGPQISNADLMLVARGQGTIENLAAANRNIIGAMYGKLVYDRAKVAAWDDFVDAEGGIANVTSTDRRRFEREFGEQNKIMDFVRQGKADTPVAGELSVNRDPSYFKEGWKYVDRNTGRVFIVKGFKEVNGKKVPDAEFVN